MLTQGSIHWEPVKYAKQHTEVKMQGQTCAPAHVPCATVGIAQENRFVHCASHALLLWDSHAEPFPSGLACVPIFHVCLQNVLFESRSNLKLMERFRKGHFFPILKTETSAY